jgi:hypothetical protein
MEAILREEATPASHPEHAGFSIGQDVSIPISGIERRTCHE